MNSLWRFLPRLPERTGFKLAGESAACRGEDQQRQLVDAIPQLAWLADPDGEIFWYNRRWYDYTGTTLERMQGWGWQSVLDPAVLPHVLSRWSEAITGGQPFEMEFPLRGAGGAFRTFLARVEPLRDEAGRVLRWIGTGTDVEEKRLAAEESGLLLANERAARGAAEDASRLKDELLATVSHELRTPLHAIVGWSHLLLNPKIEEAEIRKGLETILRNARSQTQIIDDLLDMSRIVAGKLRLDIRTVELPQVLLKTLDTMRPAAEAKGLRIETRINPFCPIKGDPVRLQQIFWNLLGNAIRFTPEGGTVQVVLERVYSHLEVRISDTGEGIDPAFLPFVFDRFRQQEGAVARQHGGLGIGLSIVKNLAELHGGQVRAMSAGDGQGSTFIVRLPVSVSDLAETFIRRMSLEAPAPFEEENEPSLADLKILIVDDEADTRDIIQRTLESRDAAVWTAASAGEALTLLGRERPHILISDIGMPHEDGYWLIRQVRALDPDRGGAIPAVALTAFARSEDRRRALRSGYQAHIAKPVEPAELMVVVAGLAGRTASRIAPR